MDLVLQNQTKKAMYTPDSYISKCQQLFFLGNGIIRKTQQIILWQDGADLSRSGDLSFQSCPTLSLGTSFLHLGGKIRF